MKESNLAAEFLVIGFVALNNFILLYLICLNINSSDFLTFIETNKELALISGTLTAYLLGTIIHRMGQLINLKLFRKIFKKRQSRLKQMTSEEYILIYQEGSQNILERVYYGERLLRIYKSTAILFPILGVESLIYFTRNNIAKFGWVTLLITLSLALLSFISHRLQTKNQVEFLHKTAAYLRNKK